MSTFILRAEKGKLSVGSDANRARLAECVKANEGKTFKLEMVQSKRSLSQNNFYWLYLGMIERETGNTIKVLHEHFRRELLPPVIETFKGKEITVPRSTTDLNKLEFGEYLDKICAETDVPLPDPVKAGYIAS